MPAPHHSFVAAGVLCGALMPPAARAGIVNVQSALTAEAPEGVSGSLTGSVDWRRGNVDLLLLGGEVVARYRAGAHLGVAIARGGYGRSGDEEIAFVKNTFEHLRYRHFLTERIAAEAFAQHEYDEFRRLELRALVGAGPRLDLVRAPRFAVAAGAAYLLEYERLRDDEAPDAGRDEHTHRASAYVTGRASANEHVAVVETVYAQPRLTGARDVRLLSESSLDVKLGARFSVATTLSIAYDSRPPDQIEKLDAALKTSMSISF